MKSGRKIYGRLLAHGGEHKQKHFRRLSNGSLRSLILHLSTPDPDGSGVRADILGRAVCEAARRFVDKGKEIL